MAVTTATFYYFVQHTKETCAAGAARCNEFCDHLETRKVQLPVVLVFRDGGRDYGLCFYELVAKREVRKGEWYLVGAVSEAHLCQREAFVGKFYVVRPTHKAIDVHTWQRGEIIVERGGPGE